MDESEKKVYEETLAGLKASPVWSKRDEAELEEIARNTALARTRFPKSDPSIPPEPPPAAEPETPPEAAPPPEETPPATISESAEPAKTPSPSEIFATDLIPEGWTVAGGVDVSPILKSASDLEFVKFVFRERHEKFILGGMMRERARNMGANFGLADLKFVLERQSEIPEELRGRLILFPGTLLWDPDPNGSFLQVPGIEWENNRWVVKFHCLDHLYGSGSRFVVRRKPPKP